MIGVDDFSVGIGSFPTNYKRDILFYDHILVMHSDAIIQQWRNGPYQKKKYYDFADEMEFITSTPYFLSGSRLAGVPVQGENIDLLNDALKEVELRMFGPNGRVAPDISPDQFVYLQTLTQVEQCWQNMRGTSGVK